MEDLSPLPEDLQCGAMDIKLHQTTTTTRCIVGDFMQVLLALLYLQDILLSPFQQNAVEYLICFCLFHNSCRPFCFQAHLFIIPYNYYIFFIFI